MTRIITTSVVFVFLLSCNVKVGKEKKEATDADKVRIDKICDAIMQAFKDDNIREAMTMLKKHSVLKDHVIDTLHATIEQQKPLFASWGKIRSFELAQEKKVGNSIARRYYVLRYEQYFNVYIFGLYKAVDGWRITGLSYNDDLIEQLYQ